jgi:hypothetical protein
LLHCEKTGDMSLKETAIRQLNWATYMVDMDGKNRYPNDDIWLTDGYGDYLRHYLRAMAAMPELAPSTQNHLLRSSSVIREIEYSSETIAYRTFDPISRERFRISFRPSSVTLVGNRLRPVTALHDLETQDGFYYEKAGAAKGLLEVKHSSTGPVVVHASSPDARGSR